MPDIPTFEYDKSFIYHINSAERINGTPSNFDYKVEVSNGSLVEYDSVVALSVSIPKSYYAIENGKNTFTFVDETDTSHNISFPEGTYSVNNFCDKLKELLDVNSGDTYTCEVNLNTAKITITSSEPTPFSECKILPGEYMYERFGFNKNSTNTFVNGVLTSQNVVDMSPENDVYIRSNIVSGGINTNEDILIDVAASGIAPFGRIQLYNIDLHGYTKGLNNTANIYNFRITDEFNNELDLNGVDWTMSILFFRKSSLPETIKDFIRFIVNKI